MDADRSENMVKLNKTHNSQDNDADAENDKAREKYEHISSLTTINKNSSR